MDGHIAQPRPSGWTNHEPIDLTTDEPQPQVLYRQERRKKAREENKRQLAQLPADNIVSIEESDDDDIPIEIAATSNPTRPTPRPLLSNHRGASPIVLDSDNEDPPGTSNDGRIQDAPLTQHESNGPDSQTGPTILSSNGPRPVDKETFSPVASSVPVTQIISTFVESGGTRESSSPASRGKRARSSSAGAAANPNAPKRPRVAASSPQALHGLSPTTSGNVNKVSSPTRLSSRVTPLVTPSQNVTFPPSGPVVDIASTPTGSLVSLSRPYFEALPRNSLLSREEPRNRANVVRRARKSVREPTTEAESDVSIELDVSDVESDALGVESDADVESESPNVESEAPSVESEAPCVDTPPPVEATPLVELEPPVIPQIPDKQLSAVPREYPSEDTIERCLVKQLNQAQEDHAYSVKRALRNARLGPGPNPEEPLYTEDPFADMEPIGVLSSSRTQPTYQAHLTLEEATKGKRTKKNFLSVPIKGYKSKATKVPRFTEYTHLRKNILGENVDKLYYWPILPHEDDTVAQRLELGTDMMDCFQMPNFERPFDILRAEQCRFYRIHVHNFLQEIGITWKTILFWYLAPRAVVDNLFSGGPPAVLGDITQVGKMLDEKEYLLIYICGREDCKRNRYDRQDDDPVGCGALQGCGTDRREWREWQAVFKQLTQPSAEELAVSALACKLFFTHLDFELWNLAQESEDAKHYLHNAAQPPKDSLSPEPSFLFTRKMCRICHLYNCAFHGEILDSPPDSPTRGPGLCHDLERTVNYKRVVSSTGPAVFPQGTNDYKATASIRKSYDQAHNVTNRNPFYPCQHEGSCEQARCRCFTEKILCEKTCGCAASCPRRYHGCSCRRVGHAQVCKPERETRERSKSACECVRLNRECDPDLCGPCGASEVLDPSNRNDEEVVTSNCRNVRIQRNVKKSTLLGSSIVHGFGLFAAEMIEPDDFLGEYIGEVVTQNEYERRGTLCYWSGAQYLFALNKTQTVDATRAGNKTRFINHKYAKTKLDNVYSAQLLCDTDIRVGLFAKRKIEKGQELFYDYGVEAEKFLRPASAAAGNAPAVSRRPKKSAQSRKRTRSAPKKSLQSRKRAQTEQARQAIALKRKEKAAAQKAQQNPNPYSYSPPKPNSKTRRSAPLQDEDQGTSIDPANKTSSATQASMDSIGSVGFVWSSDPKDGDFVDEGSESESEVSDGVEEEDVLDQDGDGADENTEMGAPEDVISDSENEGSFREDDAVKQNDSFKRTPPPRELQRKRKLVLDSNDVSEATQPSPKRKRNGGGFTGDHAINQSGSFERTLSPRELQRKRKLVLDSNDVPETAQPSPKRRRRAPSGPENNNSEFGQMQLIHGHEEKSWS